MPKNNTSNNTNNQQISQQVTVKETKFNKYICVPIVKHQYFKESFEVCLKMQTPADKEFFLLFLRLFLSAKSSTVKSENESTLQVLQQKARIILGDNQFQGNFVETLKTDFYVYPKSFEKFTDLQILHFEIQEQQLSQDIIPETVSVLKQLHSLRNLAINIKEENKGFRKQLFQPLVEQISKVDTLTVLILKWKYRRFLNLCSDQKNMKNLVKFVETYEDIYEKEIKQGILDYLNNLKQSHKEIKFDPFNSKEITNFPKLSLYKINFSKKSEENQQIIQFYKLSYFERMRNETLLQKQNLIYSLSKNRILLKKHQLFQQNPNVLQDIMDMVAQPKLSKIIQQVQSLDDLTNSTLDINNIKYNIGVNDNYFDDQIDYSSGSNDTI